MTDCTERTLPEVGDGRTGEGRTGEGREGMRKVGPA
jgi:hypothetical protein